MGPKKKLNSKENELSVSRKKYLERPSPAAINSGAKTKDNSPRKLSASATTSRSLIKPPMQYKTANGPSTTNPISVTKNVKNNDSLIVGTNNQAASSKPQKKQASRIPASTSIPKNRNTNAKVQDPKPNKVHSPNKFQSRSSTLPPVHPVAFIKDDSKSFRQNNQSKPSKFSNLNSARAKMDAQPQKTTSFGQSNASKSTNPCVKYLQDTDIINNVPLKYGDIDSNVPVKDLGIINPRSKLNDNQCNDEFNISPAIINDESPIKLSTKLEPITFKGNIINKGFESLDDLKLENLEAYISACKAPPYSRSSTSFDSQSLTPRLQNGLLKSITLPNAQNEIKTDKRKDELDTEDAITVSTIENCTSELEFNGLEVALPQTYENPSNTPKKEDSNSIKINSQALNTFQPHQLDSLGLKWGLENKRNWESNSIDKSNTENLAAKDSERDGSASSDSDKKTFTWTPEKMISFEMNEKNFSKEKPENESPKCQNPSPKSNNDSLYSLILSEGKEKEEPVNNSITPNVIPTNSELAECKKTVISHSKGDVKRVNEALNKSCSKEFNVDCEMGNKIISNATQLSETVLVPEVPHELSADNAQLNEPGTADDFSNTEELSIQNEMAIDKSEDDNSSSSIVSWTKEVFEDVNTLDVLNLAPNCNLDNGLANSYDDEYLKYIKNELKITDDDSHVKLNLGDDDEFSVESEEYYVPVSNTDSVWVDYKRHITPRIHDDSALDENKCDSWTVEEEDDDYTSSSKDGNTFVFLEADDKEWIKTEKELVDLKSLLEECSMEVQNAAHEIKNLSSKHVRNKLQYGNTNSKTKIKKKCDNIPIRSELLEISDLMDTLTEPHYDQEYDESPSEKLSYNRRIYCHEEDLDYYSMPSSDEDCKITSSKDQSSNPPKKSFLSYGKSCNNKKKKSSKILLSFFNIFK